MFDTAWSVILLFTLVCLAVNVLMYMIGYYGYGRRGVYKYNKYLPPGFLIGIIWIGIFASLGYAFYLAYTGPPVLGNGGHPKGWGVATIAIVVVSAYCLAYPLLTMFLHEKYIQVLNYLALIMSYVLGILVIREYEAAFWYVLPLIVWSSYVNFSDVMQYQDLLKTLKLQ